MNRKAPKHKTMTFFAGVREWSGEVMTLGIDQNDYGFGYGRNGQLIRKYGKEFKMAYALEKVRAKIWKIVTSPNREIPTRNTPMW